MKKAYIAKNATEAHTLCMALESAGIEAIVQGEHLGALAGGIQNVYPEVWIRNEEELERAKKVLADFKAAPPQLADDDIGSAESVESEELETAGPPGSPVSRAVVVTVAIIVIVIFFVIAMRKPERVLPGKTTRSQAG